MKKTYTHSRRLWTIAAWAGLLLMAGITLGRMEPAGKRAGLIQFDVISELSMDEGFTDTVVFARYWVWRDHYAASVVWSEPHGKGVVDMKTAVVLSDKNAFRMDNELYPNWTPTNTTYPKPLGERGPFRHGAGFYEGAEMRFAEAEALARRVYVSDLGLQKDLSAGGAGVVDMRVAEGTDGVQRKVARLKVQAKGERIESMELLDGQDRALGKMKYEYERGANASALTRLIAELPTRPEKLAVDANFTAQSSQGPKTLQIKDIDYVYHKGGRTCTVTYRDVRIGDTTLRLPVEVEVRVTENKRLLRSARLMNFQRVDLDKAGVWAAAKAFGGLSHEDRAFRELVIKYISPRPRLGPLRVDPNDGAFVARLLAKYPVREVAVMPRGPGPLDGTKQGQTSREERAESRAQWRKEVEKSRQEAARVPDPPRMEIEPNDARVMRQLVARYRREAALAQREEARKQKKTAVLRTLSEREAERSDWRRKLEKVLEYHHAPVLPEDKPPEVSASDRELIRQLQNYYEKLARQPDRGPGGRLKAIHALTRLDRMLKDYDAFEGHTARYLQMIQEAGLSGAYLVGGHGNIEILVEAGQYEKANKLLRQWAERSAAQNGAEAVFRFVGWDGDGSKRDPWASVQLLDRFLARPGLSPVERYENLAWRAVALHRTDKLLAGSETADSELRKAQAQWILSTTKRAEVARRVEPALREALAAWQALGAAGLSEAKPYSTADMSAFAMNYTGSPEATPLQETSALLNNVLRERTTRTAPGQSRTSR